MEREAEIGFSAKASLLLLKRMLLASPLSGPCASPTPLVRASGTMPRKGTAVVIGLVLPLMFSWLAWDQAGRAVETDKTEKANKERLRRGCMKKD